MDRVTENSTNDELRDFLKWYKDNIRHVDQNSDRFLRLIEISVNLNIGFTGQIWYFLLRTDLNKVELRPGTDHTKSQRR